MSMISQCVSHSTFNAFIASRFADTRQQAQLVLPKKSFDEYVSCMEEAGYRPFEFATAHGGFHDDTRALYTFLADCFGVG